MGCSNSKSEDKEAMKICKDRKHFIKQAIQHRTKFCSSHIAYIQSLSKVSKALNEYISTENELHDFIPISPSSKMIQEHNQESDLTVNYSRTSGSRSVKVQEQVIESYETIKIETSSPRNRYETDVESLFGMNLNMNSVNSQQTSEDQWDFFWNPFSSLENFGYEYDQNVMEDEINEMRHVREESENQNMKTFQDCNQTQESRILEVSKGENVAKFATNDEEKEEYTVYMNRKPISIEEVIKDLEEQFTTICNAAKEVSGLLEANQEQDTSSNEFKAIKMLDLFRSGSSLICGLFDEFSKDSCMFSGSHRSTLDRLYAWEKKLYDEVKSGERFRIAYEKKCLVLRNQELKGDDSCSVDKTRTVIQDLHTQITVSIHSIESISERIETLRDQELLPQLLELTQGLSQMWKVMAECHQIQKQTLDEAKLLLASIPFNGHKNIQTSLQVEINSQRLARSASNLESQLLNWRACFETWITSQRSYVLSLTGWLLRCLRCDPDPEKAELTSSPYLIYDVCIQWSRLFNGLNEKPMLDKLEFLAAGMSLLGLSRDRSRPWIESLEVVGSDQGGEVINDEKLGEIGVKVLCHGMAVAVSSFLEFSISLADEYMKLVSRLEDGASGPRPEEHRSRPEEHMSRPEETGI